MLKVPNDLADAFESLAIDFTALQTKHAMFLQAIGEEHRHLAARHKALWDEARDVMGFEGEWTYDAGKLTPITPQTALHPDV